jgi:hypothetical protein
MTFRFSVFILIISNKLKLLNKNRLSIKWKIIFIGVLKVLSHQINWSRQPHAEGLNCRLITVGFTKLLPKCPNFVPKFAKFVSKFTSSTLKFTSRFVNKTSDWSMNWKKPIKYLVYKPVSELMNLETSNFGTSKWTCKLWNEVRNILAKVTWNRL